MTDAPADLVVIQTANGPMYHRGYCFNADGTVIDRSVPTNSDAYTKDGVDVPYHTFYSRWVPPSAVPVIKNGPKEFVQNRWFFPMGQEELRVGNQVGYQPYSEPMSSGPVTRFGGQTGERPDLGLTTDWSALFLGNLLSQASCAPMIAAGMAGFSMPIFMLDQHGKFIDLLKYPQANNNWDHESSAFPRIPNAPEWLGDLSGRNFWPDGAHWAEIAYILFMATEDVRFLSVLQASSIYGRIQDASFSDAVNGSVAPSTQLRQWAWTTRNDLMAWKATKYAEELGLEIPSECYGSDYFDALLKNTARFAQRWIVDPAMQPSRYFPNVSAVAFWNMDYALQVLNFAMLIGRTDFDALHTWAFKNIIMRTSNKHGWPVAFPCPYGVCLGPGLPVSREARSMAPGEEYPDMGAIFDGYARDNLFSDNPEHEGEGWPDRSMWEALKADPTNGGNLIPGTEEYTSSCHSVLTQAALLANLGIKDMDALFPDLRLCHRNVTNMLKRINYEKAPRQGYAVNPDVQLYDVSAPQPVPTPTPGGGNDTPAPLPPVVPVSAPPIGFVPIKPSDDYQIVYAGDEITVTQDQLYLIVVGNGKTVVRNFANSYDERLVEATPDGGFHFVETHGPGNQLIVYGVAAIYGSDGRPVTMPDPYAWPVEPDPVPQPDPTPVPTPDPVPDPVPPQPVPLARVAVSSINTKIINRVKAGETIIVTVSKKDAAALVPLSKL